MQKDKFFLIYVEVPKEQVFLTDFSKSLEPLNIKLILVNSNLIFQMLFNYYWELTMCSITWLGMNFSWPNIHL